MTGLGQILQYRIIKVVVIIYLLGLHLGYKQVMVCFMQAITTTLSWLG